MGHLRNLCRTDLYFLLRYGCNRPDVEKPFLFEKCRAVQFNPDNRLDLWSREHYKSTIITYAKTIQDILASHGDNPLHERELTFGIFSHTRPIAKAFLAQIKAEFETNELLKEWFPDVLWKYPTKEAAKWSLDGGISVRRNSNPKEQTVEAWGVVDGQPTSKHFDVLVYDDLVTQESVSNPDQIKKTTDSLALSYNLGAQGGTRRFIGTRYHYNDTYKEIMDRGTVKPRIFPATKDGKVGGEPVLFSREELEQKRRDMGPYIYACQMLQDPKQDGADGFNERWLRYYSNTPVGTNNYIVVDPANSKRKDSDYTTIWVIGLGADSNYYVLDMVRDRLNLKERTQAVFDLHRTWQPLAVGYERFGMQSDVEHIEDKMEQLNYRFNLLALGQPGTKQQKRYIRSSGGQMSKEDRIRKLIPVFEQGRIWLPATCYKMNYEGERQDLVDVFINQEYLPFPVGIHPDMLDSLARILDDDLAATFPIQRRSTQISRSNSNWRTA